MSDGVIFNVPARRCKRCGGILTSEQGLRDGYGPCCLKKIREEEEYRQFMEKQYSFFRHGSRGGSRQDPRKREVCRSARR